MSGHALRAALSQKIEFRVRHEKMKWKLHPDPATIHDAWKTWHTHFDAPREYSEADFAAQCRGIVHIASHSELVNVSNFGPCDSESDRIRISSLRQMKSVSPVIILGTADGKSGVVLDGAHRIEMARISGVPVHFVLFTQ